MVSLQHLPLLSPLTPQISSTPDLLTYPYLRVPMRPNPRAPTTPTPCTSTILVVRTPATLIPRTPTSTASRRCMPNNLRIAALGSSFAAGPSIEPIENQAAGRSSRNYAHQLAEKLNAELVDLTVSGATILNVLDEKQATGGQVFDPQLDHLPADVDIVTLTCGGNDINYLGSLTHDTLVSHLGAKHPLAAGISNAPALDPQTLTDRLVKVLDKIHKVAPQSKVYLVEYPAIIGNHTRPRYDIALTAKRIKHYEAVADMLAQAYVDAAEARSFSEVVAIAELSRDHGLGSEEPWIRGFSVDMMLYGPATYHPNLAGHTAVAGTLYRQILASREVSQATGRRT